MVGDVGDRRLVGAATAVVVLAGAGIGVAFASAIATVAQTVLVCSNDKTVHKAEIDFGGTVGNMKAPSHSDLKRPICTSTELVNGSDKTGTVLPMEVVNLYRQKYVDNDVEIAVDAEFDFDIAESAVDAVNRAVQRQPHPQPQQESSTSLSPPLMTCRKQII